MDRGSFLDAHPQELMDPTVLWPTSTYRMAPRVQFPDGLEQALPLRDQRCLPDDALPVLDPVPLMDMLDDVGDQAARKFVDEYLELLPQRVSWIVTALATGDP